VRQDRVLLKTVDLTAVCIAVVSSEDAVTSLMNPKSDPMGYIVGVLDESAAASGIGAIVPDRHMWTGQLIKAQTLPSMNTSPS
jgi:hypothetical protein